MSGVAVVRYKLAQNSALTKKVPDTRIMAGILPISSKIPAIVIQSISNIEHLNVALDDMSVLMTNRVQVTVFSKTYPELKQIMDMVRVACKNYRGLVNTIEVDSILPDTVGPDMYDGDNSIYMQTRDLIVKYIRVTF